MALVELKALKNSDYHSRIIGIQMYVKKRTLKVIYTNKKWQSPKKHESGA
jgi:hypothetical protein